MNQKGRKGITLENLRKISMDDWFDITKEFEVLGERHREPQELLLESTRNICPFLDELLAFSKGAKELGEEEKAVAIDTDIYFWCLLYVLGKRMDAWN